MRRNGFTLIEALLGLSLFSLIALTLYTLLFSGIRLSNDTERIARTYGGTRWAMATIERDLERMVLYTDPQTKLPIFSFKDGVLRFVVRTDKGLQAIQYGLEEPGLTKVRKTVIHQDANGLDEVIVRQEEKRERRDLVRREISLPEFYGQKLDFTGKENGQVLLKDLQPGSLKISFPFESKGRIEWRDKWSDTKLPIGVRLEADVFQDEGPALHLQRDIFIPTGSVGSET